MEGVPIQQTMTTILPINVFVTIGLLVYGNGVPIQQPKRANSYPQSDGELFESSLNGGSLKGRSLDQTHLECHHLIHMSDFMDGKHLI
jgi:hypothetical protein